MFAIYFFHGLAFWLLGFAAYLQTRREVSLPLRKQIPWLAAFGFAAGATGWVEMFLTTVTSPEIQGALTIARMILQPAMGLLLLIFGWGILTRLTPLPSWVIFIPGVLIVPIAFLISYASTTFITPSPIEIPIDIWSRYLLYLPGSVMAGIGFLRQQQEQKQAGYTDVSRLLLVAGLAFLLEALVVGLVVPVAPYGPASYYNYNRVVYNAFIGENMDMQRPYGLSSWLDYGRVLDVTGFPIQFWRMLSAFLVTFFVSRGLDVFDATIRREVQALQDERDSATRAAFETQLAARISAENWTNALVGISRRISELDDVDNILLYIVDISRRLLDSDFIGLALLENHSPHLNLKAYSSKQGTEILKTPIIVKNALILRAISSASSYRSDERESIQALEDSCLFSDRPAQALAVVVLNLDNQPIGALWVARFDRKPYSETDLIWLESLADQVDIAIQHGVMTSQLQSLSITEERGRIAREMHDSLAQILGYLNLQIQTLEVMHQQGNGPALQEELWKMRQAVQAAHADVRENILSLRTTLASEKGLETAIQEYLEEFGYQTGIKTHLVNETSEELSLSPIAEIQLVCILQEALANVRKHSQARHVSVNVSQVGSFENRLIQMAIVDDGVGFAAGDKKRHFGLATMHERARSAGGEFFVRSRPGEGTLVICQLPYVPREQQAWQRVEAQES